MPRDKDKHLPYNWPDDILLPTEEEVKECMNCIEKMAENLLKEYRKGLRPLSGEDLETVIGI